ncbi:6659_t:CDS:1 [Cetraspora pellucida]|uniref:6659_t:CDS:1 n=1 Tax=Cetraspora pellucida TaxID=1433469 RepID=A0ACA9K9H1_9GLOM|nr:6659_t:CDS:1 [Cetraspora pellucida]
MERSTAVNNKTNGHDESCNESLVTGDSPNKIENDNDLVIECSHNIKKDNESPVTESFSSNIENEDDSSNVEIDIETSVIDNVIATEDEGAVGEDVILVVGEDVMTVVGEDVIPTVNVATNDDGAVGGNVIPAVVAIDDEGAVGEDVFPMEIDDFLLRGSKFQESVPLFDQYVNGLTELILMDIAH